MFSEKDDKPFWDKGLKFSCKSCGHCCRHEPGYVFLSQPDLDILVQFKKMTEEVFINKYCRTVDLGITTRLSLTETVNFNCIFWNQGCTVYAARPLQCRTYPFWPSVLSSRKEWDNEALECPGINQGEMHSQKEISDALKKREREILISPSR